MRNHMIKRILGQIERTTSRSGAIFFNWVSCKNTISHIFIMNRASYSPGKHIYYSGNSFINSSLSKYTFTLMIIQISAENLLRR